MIARALFVCALAYTAAAIEFTNPSANLNAPGGLYVQNPTAQGFSEVDPQFGGSYCPDTQFFGNVTVTFMGFKGQCLVKYSAVMWSNNVPTIVFDEMVYGEAQLFHSIRVNGYKNPTSSPCYITVNDVEYSVYTDLSGPAFVSFVDHSKGCKQFALITNDVNDEVLDEPASMEAYFTFENGAVPVGPLSIEQQSSGDVIVTSMFILSNRSYDVDGIFGPSDDDEKPNIFSGNNRREYLKYNMGLVIGTSRYAGLQINADDVPADDIVADRFTGIFSVYFSEHFKKRQSSVNLIGDITQVLSFGNNLNFNFVFEEQMDSFGKRSLYMFSNSSVDPHFVDYLAFGESIIRKWDYTLVRKNLPSNTNYFTKRTIDEWFGGMKQKYTPPTRKNGNPAGIRKPERKRRKHRKNKRRKGNSKKAVPNDQRDHRRFKLAPSVL